jgi:hypothetical protein
MSVVSPLLVFNIPAIEKKGGEQLPHPTHPEMLDVVGFDAATPQLISDFARAAL